jgi:hypothetical protein
MTGHGRHLNLVIDLKGHIKGRSIAAGFLGLLIAFVLTAAADLVASKAVPLPPGIDVSKPETLQTLDKTMPTSAFAIVQAGWLLSAFTAAAFAAWMAR